MTLFQLGRPQVTYLVCQALVILFYGLFVEFKSGTDPKGDKAKEDATAQDMLRNRYASFQDIHVMVFIGFGFLMTFLKSHNWSSIGYNYLIAAWAVQIEILCSHFWDQIFKYYDNYHDHNFEKLNIGVWQLIEGDFGAASMLVAMGALIGKTSLYQLFTLSCVHIFFFTINKQIILQLFKVSDIGGSMIIHTYGAYFGLAASFFFYRKEASKDENKQGKGNYLSGLIAMTGTLFLFCYFPSFNSALAKVPGSQQMRAIINTYLSLSCSVIAAVIVSRITKRRLLDMEIILNASLAGGVVMGCNAVLIILPFGAMLAGFIVGCVTSFGYAYLTPLLRDKFNIHDTCGIHNLYAIPGIIAGIISAIVASRGDIIYGNQYNNVFELDTTVRAATYQAGFQLAAIATSIGLGIFGGIIGGLIVGTHNPFFMPMNPKQLFDDRWAWWECVIDHHRLVELKKKYDTTMSIIQGGNLKKAIPNFPVTVQDEQDWNNLNIDRSAGPTDAVSF